MIGYYLLATMLYISSHLILLTIWWSGVILLYRYGIWGRESVRDLLQVLQLISSREGDSNPILSESKVCMCCLSMGKQGGRGLVMALEEWMKIGCRKEKGRNSNWGWDRGVRTQMESREDLSAWESGSYWDLARGEDGKSDGAKWGSPWNSSWGLSTWFIMGERVLGGSLSLGLSDATHSFHFTIL